VPAADVGLSSAAWCISSLVRRGTRARFAARHSFLHLRMRSCSGGLWTSRRGLRATRQMSTPGSLIDPSATSVKDRSDPEEPPTDDYVDEASSRSRYPSARCMRLRARSGAYGLVVSRLPPLRCSAIAACQVSSVVGKRHFVAGSSSPSESPSAAEGNDIIRPGVQPSLRAAAQQDYSQRFATLALAPRLVSRRRPAPAEAAGPEMKRAACGCSESGASTQSDTIGSAPATVLPILAIGRFQGGSNSDRAARPLTGSGCRIRPLLATTVEDHEHEFCA